MEIQQINERTTKDIEVQIGNKFNINEQGSNTDSQTVINKQCFIRTQENIQNNYYSKETQRPTTKIIYQVPDPVQSFCGRENDLQNIDSLFEQNNIVTITGMAGIGKTELAKNYINKYRAKYKDNLIWINAETKENIKNSFHGLATMFEINLNQNLRTIVQMVYSYFKDTTVLFVIDNADSRQNIREFLPSKVAHKDIQIFVLITSQNNDWGDSIPTVLLEILSENVALDVFQAILGDRFKQEDKEYLLELAKILNYIPLALQIAASYVNEEIKSYETVDQTFNVKDYLTKLKNGDHKLLDKNFPENTENDYTKTIYSAVKISLENIEKNNSEESKVALDILYISSYLDASKIEYNAFLPMHGINNSKDVLIKAYSMLKKFSLISINNNKINYDKYINIHRLVQWILRYHQQQQNIKNKYYTTTLDLLQIAHGIEKQCHLESIFRYGEQEVELFANYYFINKPEKFLERLVCFNCISVLKHIFDSMFTLKAKWFIWSNELLFKAIQSAEMQTVDLILQYGPVNIHRRYQSDWTLLHFATNLVEANKIKRVIELGALANTTEESGLTPLHLICGARWMWKRQNETDIIECGRLLINKAKANVNALTNSGSSPLLFASNWLLLQVSEWLLKECKAEVNIVDKYGDSILSSLIMEPITSEQNAVLLIDIGRLLIAHGARTDFRACYKNSNLLHLAINSKSLLVVRWVVEECHIDVNSQDALADTALHILAYKVWYTNDQKDSSIEICKFLINRGAKLDIKNVYGLTPVKAIKKSGYTFLLNYVL